MPVTQPLILVDDDAGRPPAVKAGDKRRSRWSSAAVWSAVLVVTLIALAELRRPPPTVGDEVEAKRSTGESTDAPGLVVRAIPPDEEAAVFSPPDRRFCGDLELHLDGSPVPLRTLVETDAGLLVTFEAPARAQTGPHELELIGGTPAPKAMGACRESARYRRTIAVTTAHV